MCIVVAHISYKVAGGFVAEDHVVVVVIVVRLRVQVRQLRMYGLWELVHVVTVMEVMIEHRWRSVLRPYTGTSVAVRSEKGKNALR